MTGIGLNKKQIEEVILEKMDCYNYGGTWKTHDS